MPKETSSPQPSQSSQSSQSSQHNPMHSSVADVLAVEIIDGIWEEGTSITLEDIQSRFGVSRTVAREAARLLESLGCVELRRRVGIVAQNVQSWKSLNTQVIDWKLKSSMRSSQLKALTEFRLAIEPAAAANCARYAPLDFRARIPLIAREMRKAVEDKNLEHFHQLDTQFHTSILAHSHNELFASFSETIATVLKGRVETGKYPTEPKPEAIDAHEAVALAIWEENPQNAYEAMRDIVTEVNEALNFDTM